MPFIGRQNKAIQVMFYDDNSFEFRSMPLENTFVVEKKDQNIVNAWPLPYKVMKRFSGWRNFKPGRVLLSYTRDIILDVFNQIGKDELPEQGAGLVKDYVTAIATSVFYRHEARGKRGHMDRFVNYLGAPIIIFGLVIAIVAVVKVVGNM